MSENIFVRPARHIQSGPVREKPETSLGQVPAPFTVEQPVHFIFKAMKIKHIRRGIVDLFRAQCLRCPVRRLLLFGKFDPEVIAA